MMFDKYSDLVKYKKRLAGCYNEDVRDIWYRQCNGWLLRTHSYEVGNVDNLRCEVEMRSKGAFEKYYLTNARVKHTVIYNCIEYGIDYMLGACDYSLIDMERDPLDCIKRQISDYIGLKVDVSTCIKEEVKEEVKRVFMSDLDWVVGIFMKVKEDYCDGC